MSEDSPTWPQQPAEHTTPLESFETVGPGAPGGGGPRRRSVIGAVAVVVVAMLGGGAYAAYSFLDGGGPEPAEVLPASTLAALSVDLDPSASQKVAAIRSIRKFPALKKSLGLQADDDLRRFAFDKIVDGHCGKLDFEHDVKPWLGKRAALAAVDLGGRNPVPVVALQISDHDKAQAGFQALVDCTDPQHFGFAVGKDYLVASDSADHARTVLAQGETKPLSDDATYRRWTTAAGDPGVVSFYVGPGAARYGERLLDDAGSNLFDSGRGSFSFDQGTSGYQPSSDAPGDATTDVPGDAATAAPGGGSTDGATDPQARAKSALAHFRGLAGTVRFSGGGMELSVAGGGVDQLQGLATIGPDVSVLPADTAAAVGFGVGKDYAKQLVEGFTGLADLTTLENQTGLQLPDDLQTLLGSGVTLSLGGHAPHSLSDVSGPEDVPAGVVLHGDPTQIQAVITKIEQHLGMQLSDIPMDVQGSGHKLAISTGGYGPELLKDGTLGSVRGFRDAVPEADKAGAILYVDFDSAWRDALARELTKEGGTSASDFDANTKPLHSLGLSSWVDGDTFHGLLKITTD